MAKVTFTKGKKSRNELRLPELHFIVADDWIKKLGEKAFCAWLRFHTWVDRTDDAKEKHKIPYKIEAVAKKLGMSKTTLYRTIIPPLWEYGLIDLIEYEDSKKKGQKPCNIIVYESPMNLHETKVMPLVKLRDWQKDYGSTAQVFGQKGGRPKTKKDEAPSEGGKSAPDGFKNETVNEDDPNRFKNETVDGFKNETDTVSKMKPNNDTNISTNDPNKQNNDTNQQQQDEPVADQDQDVVVGYQNLIESLFGKTLKEKEIKTLMELAIRNGKRLKQCILNAKDYIDLKEETATNPMGLIRYEIENGFDLEALKAQLEAEKNQQQEQQAVSEEEDLQDLPMAIRLQIEREKAKKAQQQPSDSEEKEDKESLAEKRARIQQKLKKMRDGLSTRGKRA